MAGTSGKRGRAILLRDQLLLESSFVVKDENILDGDPWHFHPEIEIMFCCRSGGTYFIGSNVSAIREGDLFLIGKNLAHTRQHDDHHRLQNPPHGIDSIVVKFKEDLLGSKFFQIPDFNHIDTLLQSAQRGIKFNGKVTQVVGSRLKKMQRSGVGALMEIISILDLLTKSDEFTFLNPADSLNESSNRDLQNINIVFEFTNKNFREAVTLAQVASLLNLTEAAFCRYFKSRTRKSYFQYLTEVRIANVCKMLQEEDKDVVQVCYSNGFNNPSHFHKQFKKIVNLTPKEYRKKVLERIA